MRISSRLRTCASVSPSPSRGRDLRQRLVRDAAGRGHRFDLVRVLGASFCFDHTSGRSQFGVEGRGPAAVLRERHVIGFEPDPIVPAAQAGQVRLRLRARGADEHGTVDARRRHLLRGLAAVAAVGDEREVVTADDCPSVGAGEAGEPAQVGEVAHQEGVDVREPGPHPDDSIGDGHAAASLRATASTAST
jgi:hypothetical protein